MGRISFVEQLNRTSEMALKRMLEEQYDMTVDSTTTAEQMRETIIRLKEDAKKKAEKTIEEAAKTSFFADEPIYEVLFQHLDGDKEHKFHWDGGKGVPSKNGKWLQKLPFFHLIDGEKYKLPLCVIDYLNGITVPDVKPIQGPGGQITNERYMRKRFSCEIVGLRETLEKQKQQKLAEPAVV